MKYLSTLAIFTLFVFALVGCGGGGDEGGDASGGGTATLSVVQNDIYYGDSPTNAEDPPVWTVPAGANVRLSLENLGTLEHNWAIVNLGESVPDVYNAETDSGILLYEAGLVEGGGTFSESFTAPSEAGSYTIICTVAGHWPGMQGVLEVQ